jgi:hypothetical protein
MVGRILRRSQGHARIERGQSLVEMTFGMLILIMIVAGVVDLGRAYFTFIALEDAAGEAALFMSAFPECPYDALVSGIPSDNDGTAGEDCDPPNNALWRAKFAGGTSGLINWTTGNVGWDITCYDDDGVTEIYCTDADPGDTVDIIITYDFTIVTPYVPSSGGTNPHIVLTGRATEIVVGAE